jgi:hypothetical protein
MQSDSSARMIVEVTPRWRYIMRERGTDWSIRAVRDHFLGRWVKVRGWMLFDSGVLQKYTERKVTMT